MAVNFWERLILLLSLGVITMFALGTRGCQEDYFFANQASTPTPSPSVSLTPDDDETPTLTPTNSIVVSAFPTAASTSVPSLTPASDPISLSALSAVRDLKSLDKPQIDDIKNESGSLSGTTRASGSADIRGNWLGEAFSNSKDKEECKEFIDSDGDGFADWLEIQEGRDVHASRSIPSLSVEKYGSILDMIASDSERNRLWDIYSKLHSPEAKEVDSDGDGLADRFEELIGTDPNNPDSDCDGVSDGVEWRFNLNPKG
ncbi:MAG TPA: hypothetical protein PKD37_01790 [Oligoflexia bacterium]|nr:hypothetical protein [Oligoflexia bacterium]HMP26709.1 hypothetical protein [Oligoflexia bacterium]